MSKKEEVYKALKSRILIQHYRPGDLISERDIMNEYKIGRTPLREVFFHLQHEGLILRFPRIGTIVSPIDIKQLHDVLEIRLHLEGIIGRLAAKRISQKELEEMHTSLQKMDEAAVKGDIDSYVAEEALLHSMLYIAAGNATLREFMETQYSLFTRIWFTVERTPIDLTEQTHHWKTIWQALCEKDEEKAATSNIQHFQASYAYLKNLI